MLVWKVLLAFGWCDCVPRIRARYEKVVVVGVVVVIVVASYIARVAHCAKVAIRVVVEAFGLW